MNTIKIVNSDEQLTPNIKMVEWWSPSVTPTKIDFDCPACLPPAVQCFRDFFEMAWLITSTIRLNDADWSPHKNGTAVDSVCADTTQWSEILTKIRTEFQSWKTSKLVKSVIDTGCNVLLIENGCLHLSVRDFSLHTTQELGQCYIGEWAADGTELGKNIAYSYND